MNILVIGASGFAGSVIYQSLICNGHNVVGTRCSSHVQDLIRFDLVEDSLADILSILPEKKRSFDLVVICAVICQIDRCYRERELSYKVNVVATKKLIKECTKKGIKTLFCSTGFVFDGDSGYYSEDDLRNPICEYGRHKAEVEAYLEDYIDGACTLRFDKIVGTNSVTHHLFTEWYELIQKKKPIRCISDQIFAPTTVSDVAQSVVKVAECKLEGVYHVANQEFFMRDELAYQFCREMGINHPIESYPQESFSFADRRPLKTYLDSAKYIQKTGFQFTSMRSAFKQFLSGIEKNGI